jgi:hypothetical protein
MALPHIALPGTGIEVVLGAPIPATRNESGRIDRLSELLNGAMYPSNAGSPRMQFPWTWLARLEDLPLPSAMIASLAAGGIVYALQLAEMLGRSVPLLPRVRRDLEACCRQLGIEPGDQAPAWFKEHLETLEAAFGEAVRHKVVEHVSWQLPFAQAVAPAGRPAEGARPAARGGGELPWMTLPAGLAVPALQRPVIALTPPDPVNALTGFTVAGPGALELTMAYPVPSSPADRVWLWKREEAEPVGHALCGGAGRGWRVEGIANAHSVLGVSLERSGVCLGSTFRSEGDLAEVVLIAEGWENLAGWLRWSRAPVFEGLVKRAVARRVKAEPEATLAAWLAADGPDGLAAPGGPATAELFQEFFGNWWASAEEADAMLRAASLQGKDPEAWVRLAEAYPILLGQVLAAGWLERPASARQALRAEVCDRLARWITPEGQGGEAHWELAEQVALGRAAAEWGVGEWFFTSRGQIGALSDWVHGRPVPPEMRRRWMSAWAGPGACQWTAMHVVRELWREARAGAEVRTSG